MQWVVTECLIVVMLMMNSTTLFANQDIIEKNLLALEEISKQAHPKLVNPQNIDQIKASIKSMAEVDQKIRQKLNESTANIPEDSRAEYMQSGLKVIYKVDEKHTLVLKDVLKHHVWFPISQFGQNTAHNAWLIAQHSQDFELQKKVLWAMQALVNDNEAIKSDYALLYDRVATHEGRPQKYGSQFFVNETQMLECYGIENKKHIDRLRANVGLNSMTQYLQDVEAMYGMPVERSSCMDDMG